MANNLTLEQRIERVEKVLGITSVTDAVNLQYYHKAVMAFIAGDKTVIDQYLKDGWTIPSQTQDGL